MGISRPYSNDLATFYALQDGMEIRINSTGDVLKLDTASDIRTFVHITRNDKGEQVATDISPDKFQNSAINLGITDFPALYDKMNAMIFASPNAPRTSYASPNSTSTSQPGNTLTIQTDGKCAIVTPLNQPGNLMAASGELRSSVTMPTGFTPDSFYGGKQSDGPSHDQSLRTSLPPNYLKQLDAMMENPAFSLRVQHVNHVEGCTVSAKPKPPSPARPR